MYVGMYVCVYYKLAVEADPNHSYNLASYARFLAYTQVTYIYIYMCVCVFICVWVCVRVYVCMYVCMYVCTTEADPNHSYNLACYAIFGVYSGMYACLGVCMYVCIIRVLCRQIRIANACILH